MNNNFTIPIKFLTVQYKGSHYPGNTIPAGVGYSANCQYFVYEILRYFGYKIGALRSSNFWEDTMWTIRVKRLARRR